MSTPAGTWRSGSPSCGRGSFFPELLEPRRRIDKALWAVIMHPYITGTSTRKVDDLVKALRCDSGVSKSTVSPTSMPRGAGTGSRQAGMELTNDTCKTVVVVVEPDVVLGRVPGAVSADGDPAQADRDMMAPTRTRSEVTRWSCIAGATNRSLDRRRAGRQARSGR